MGILVRPRSKGGLWASTRWSIVSGLSNVRDPRWQEGWRYLTEAYREPMIRYARSLLRRFGQRGDAGQDAEDIVQGFLAACLEKDWLDRADRDLGRFRTFVQVLLRRYLVGWMRRRRAKRRHPGEGVELHSLRRGEGSADAGPGPAPPPDPADAAAFDRGFAEVAVRRALDRLSKHNARYARVIRDLIATEGEGSSGLGAELGLRHAQVPVLRHRARKRFSELFEEELRATVRDAEAFDEEWEALAPYLP